MNFGNRGTYVYEITSDLGDSCVCVRNIALNLNHDAACVCDITLGL